MINLKHIVFFGGLLAGIFLFTIRFEGAPYFILTFSSFLALVSLGKEIYFFYLYSCFFWLPFAFHYGVMADVLGGAFISEILIYVGCVGWLAKGVLSLRLRKTAEDMLKTPFLPALALFFVTGIFTYFISAAEKSDFAYSLFRINYFYGPAVYFLCTKIFKNSQEIKISMLALVIGGCMLAGIFYYYFQFHPELLIIEFSDNVTFSKSRFGGGYIPFGRWYLSMDILTSATFVSFLLPIAVTFYLIGQNRIQRFLGLISSIILVTCLIFTQTRSCWISAIIGVAIIVILCKKYTAFTSFELMLLVMVSIAAIVVILHYTILAEHVAQRIDTLRYLSEDSSLGMRIEVWWSTLRVILSNPLGVGYRIEHELGYLAMPHNTYLTIALENGVLALIALAWFMVVWFKRMFFYLSSGSIMDKTPYIAAVGSVVSFLLSAFFGTYSHHFVIITVFWLVCGLAMNPKIE